MRTALIKQHPGTCSNHPTILLNMTSTSPLTAFNLEESTLNFVGRDQIYNYTVYSQPGEWTQAHSERVIHLPSVTRYDSKCLRYL
jgi:hypothetical protein